MVPTKIAKRMVREVGPAFAFMRDMETDTECAVVVTQLFGNEERLANMNQQERTMQCAVLNKTTYFLITVLVVVILPTKSRAQLIDVNMGVAFVNARLAPLWVVEKQGLFKKNGLQVKLTNISGGTQGAQAMLAGGIDLGYTDPTSMVSAIAAGAPLVEVISITASCRTTLSVLAT